MPLYSIPFPAEFREEIRIAIPSIVECLEDSHSDIRQAALDGLSSLSTHGMHYLFANPLYSILFSAEFRQDIWTAIPSILKCLEDPHSHVQRAALNGLLSLTTHGMHHLFANAAVLDPVFS